MQTTFSRTDAPTGEGPWYRHRWPWFVMAGPVVVILASAVTGWLAFSRQDAMVADDYYIQGKAINQDLRRDEIATRLGLSLSGRYDPATGRLQGSLSGFGKPFAGKIRIHLAHASEPNKDLGLDAIADQRGEFTVGLPMLERSQWRVLVESQRRDWRLTGVWQWPQRQTVDLHAGLSVVK